MSNKKAAKPLLFVIAAPSGGGKSSFVERITSQNSQLVDIITYTTRAMRHNESQGKPYFFASVEEFLKRQADGYFIESARVHNNWYGTPLDQIEKAWSDGCAAIMDIDVQGVKTFKEKFPERAVSVFIQPPSLEVLRERLIARGGGKAPQDIDLRLTNAKKEMAEAHLFDYQVLNDDFEESYLKFRKLIENLL